MNRETAEQQATRMYPQGCMCPNNGAADCEWCEAVEIILSGEEEIGLEAELKNLADASEILE